MTSTVADRSRLALDRLLDPVRAALTPESARAIADLRADAATQARLDWLAERHHESQLTAEELEEYETMVHAVSMIAVLQAKARSALKRFASP